MAHLNNVELYHATMSDLNNDLAIANHNLWKLERTNSHVIGVKSDEEIIKVRYTILNIEDDIKQIQLARMQQILIDARDNRGENKDDV